MNFFQKKKKKKKITISLIELNPVSRFESWSKIWLESISQTFLIFEFNLNIFCKTFGCLKKKYCEYDFLKKEKKREKKIKKREKRKKKITLFLKEGVYN